MMHAGRTAAGWLGGRVLLFALALGALMVAEVAGDRDSSLRAQAEAWLPDARLLADLENRRTDALREADALRVELNARLAQAHEQSPQQLAAWLEDLDREIAQREAQRLDAMGLVLAAGDPHVVVEHARNEAALQVMRWTRDEVLRTLRGIADMRVSEPQAMAAVADARARHRVNSDVYWQAKRTLAAVERAHPLAAIIPFERLGLHDEDRRRVLSAEAAWKQAAERVIASRAALTSAERTLDRIRRARAATARPLAAVDPRSMASLDAVIAARRRAVDQVQRSLDEIVGRAGKLAWTAFWIVVLLSLLPLALKAFWYHVMAPLAARRPPIRIAPGAQPTGLPPDVATSARISSVSLDVQLERGEELLVHPEYLQSFAQPGEKRTRWLLDARYPFMSVAAGMVALTRVRGAGHACTVSSRRDPLAEIGAIDVSAGGQFVLHPRHLVGVLQQSERPVHIASHWNFGLGAWITLQFRYLVFHGPCRLLVAGCRGVRQEAAGTGRSVDQAATIGFSANLDYVPRRSATFGAYLLGVNGLFDDGFEGGPGVFVYEEMPYGGRRVAGLSGRGLEGTLDVVLRAFGV